MHPFSDSDTSDSEDGIRFKTQNTRNKGKSVRERRPRSPNSRESSRRRRSHSPSRHRWRLSRSRDRDRHRHKKHRARDNLVASSRQSTSTRKSDSVRPVKSNDQVPDCSNHKIDNIRSQSSRHFDKQESERSKKSDIGSSSDSSAFGPSLPPKFIQKDGGSESDNDLKIGRNLKTENIQPTSVKAEGECDTLQSRKDETLSELDSCFAPYFPIRKHDTFIESDLSSFKTKNDDTLIELDSSNFKLIKDDILTQLNSPGFGPNPTPRKDNAIESNSSSFGLNVMKDSSSLLPKNIDSFSCRPNKDDMLIESESSSFGPSLPPSFSKTEVDAPKYIGPFLPEHLREKLQNNEDISDYKSKDEEEDDAYGPLPVDVNPRSSAHVALEERALQMKLDKLNPCENAKPAREQWMTELPSAAAKIGLGPRQFRAKAGPDLSDRSSWTDTPQDTQKDKTKPVDLKEEADLLETKRRDKEQEDIIKNHKKKKKRDKSLLEQHQEKIKKKKEEDSTGASVRRPFSRDIDLKVNHFDDAQKKAILKKAQMLDDRFSKGQSKYL